MSTILLTGFVPFDGETVNPSERAVLAIAAEPPPGLVVRTAVLPVSYANAAAALWHAITRHAPDVVLATGLAGGRAAISVERVAINLDDADKPDNDGLRRNDTPIVPDGPAAYFATVPIKAIAGAIRAAGVPAQLSLSAGTFLCNHVFYQACHFAATRRSGLLVGFLHLPWLPEQVAARPAEPSMALTTQIAGLRAALAVLRHPASTDGGKTDRPAADGAAQ